MEISTYPVTLILRLYQKFFAKRVHGNFHVPSNIETTVIEKCFYLKHPWIFPCIRKYWDLFRNSWTKESIEISTYPVTSRLIQQCFYLRINGPWKFPRTLYHYFWDYIRNSLPKGSIEISMYPVTLRLIIFKNVLPKGSMEISMYPVILGLIQKFFTKRAHGNFRVPSNIETNSKLFFFKGPWKFPCIL